ncbi:hypothetical protein PputUW4_02198 [Pseudomonas sp. UW4]|nr:hypothetical protein PputUW4_02198 [Pseudomonas sp. UW4]
MNCVTSCWLRCWQRKRVSVCRFQCRTCLRLSACAYYYAQVDTPDLGGINRVVLLRAFSPRSIQWLSMVAIRLKA